MRRSTIWPSTRWALAAAIVIAGLLAAAPPAHAASKTQVSVDYGWGGHTRFGRWMPISVTMSDPNPRGVTVSLYAPHDPSTAMHIEQQMTIGPQPHTYMLFAPLNAQLSETKITVFDDRTGKALTDPIPLVASDNDQYTSGFSSQSGLFIGASGRAPFLSGGNSRNDPYEAGFLVTHDLPDVPIGYDALDLLVLNSIDFNKLMPEQQQAIVDWVHAGGSLLLWPAEGPIPTDPRSDPLINLLPCRIGDSRIVDLNRQQVASAGINARAKTLRVRQLIPADDAHAMASLGVAGAVVHARRGLGDICVLGFDPSTLPFDSGRDIDFLKPIFADAHLTLAESQANSYNPYALDNRVAAERGHLMDLLGTVPGMGQFGFGYVALGLALMMIVVGPVDWLVLRWMRRQPWTWVTTSGWIALITLGSIYVGHVFKSGDLHFRSIRLIDQVDNHTVASHQMVGIYSPRTTEYKLATTPDGWWQPVNLSGNYYGGSGGLLAELPFAQKPQPGASEATENVPGGIPINVWNLRFLESAHLGMKPPAVEARLWINGHTAHAIVTNHSDAPMSDLWLRTDSGIAMLSPLSAGGNQTPLAPGATLSYAGDIERYDWIKAGVELEPGYGMRTEVISGLHPNPDVPARRLTDRERTIASVGGLSNVSDGFMRHLLDGQHACLYTFSDSAPPDSQLEADKAIQKHYLVIRALLAIGEAPTGQ